MGKNLIVISHCANVVANLLSLATQPELNEYSIMGITKQLDEALDKISSFVILINICRCYISLEKIL
jgi:hypothetical protein